MSWIWILVALSVGWGLGYLTKDRLTEEYVSNVTMHKPRVRGRGNTLDADQVTEVHMQKMTWRQKRDARKASKDKAD